VAIGNIFQPFGIVYDHLVFLVIWIIFPVLVWWTVKNLAIPMYEMTSSTNFLTKIFKGLSKHIFETALLMCGVCLGNDSPVLFTSVVFTLHKCSFMPFTSVFFCRLQVYFFAVYKCSFIPLTRVVFTIIQMLFYTIYNCSFIPFTSVVLCRLQV
jgi:hypothetical protein